MVNTYTQTHTHAETLGIMHIVCYISVLAAVM